MFRPDVYHGVEAAAAEVSAGVVVVGGGGRRWRLEEGGRGGGGGDLPNYATSWMIGYIGSVNQRAHAHFGPTCMFQK